MIVRVCAAHVGVLSGGLCVHGGGLSIRGGSLTTAYTLGTPVTCGSLAAH